MMLPTGSDLRLRLGERSFTLVEVMVAVAVLSLATVLIFESFFISLDAFGYYSNYLTIAPWMDELLWEAQDNLMRQADAASLATKGETIQNNKTFYWDLSYSKADEKLGLYRVDLACRWREGKRDIRLNRFAYVFYAKK